MASANTPSMSTISSMDPNLSNQVHSIEQFEILGQPCYKTKLRYRSDFERKRNRRAVLRSHNNPNHPSPTIRIPPSYLNFSQYYYIRICLVTILSEQSQRRYIHPYDLEDTNNGQYNDRHNNAVWFPIKEEDSGGVKSFPNLRIVKKTENELKNYGDLHVFDSPNSFAASHSSSPKETIKEFNLDRQQLAFTLAQRTVINGELTNVPFASTTVFSDEVIQIIGRRSDTGSASTNSTTTSSHTPKPPIYELYKYGPRQGYPEKHDEIYIIYNNPLRSMKYGDVEVSFEYHTPLIQWSEPVLNLAVNDKVVTLNTPSFPFPIDCPTTVNVVLKQKRRIFETLQFQYIPEQLCARCRENSIIVGPNNPNKRAISEIYPEETERTQNINEPNLEIEIPFSPSTMFSDFFENLKK